MKNKVEKGEIQQPLQINYYYYNCLCFSRNELLNDNHSQGEDILVILYCSIPVHV